MCVCVCVCVCVIERARERERARAVIPRRSYGNTPLGVPLCVGRHPLRQRPLG
jgi:hypothetical protein